MSDLEEAASQFGAICQKAQDDCNELFGPCAVVLLVAQPGKGIRYVTNLTPESMESVITSAAFEITMGREKRDIN